MGGEEGKVSTIEVIYTKRNQDNEGERCFFCLVDGGGFRSYNDKLHSAQGREVLSHLSNHLQYRVTPAQTSSPIWPGLALPWNAPHK